MNIFRVAVTKHGEEGRILCRTVPDRDCVGIIQTPNHQFLDPMVKRPHFVMGYTQHPAMNAEMPKIHLGS
jgi:hypothetical protein